MINCDCSSRFGIEVNSWKRFKELEQFFNKQVQDGVFLKISVDDPYFVGNVEWYADEWYRCNICGCLWEFKYPDFPAVGFVRKFSDGKYHAKEVYF